VHLDELVPHAGSIKGLGCCSLAKKNQNDGHSANRLRTSVKAASHDDGWATLSEICSS
jgi:hypothetical protein